jgi:elongation factor Ts
MSAINVKNAQEVRRRTRAAHTEARVGRVTGEGLITTYAHHNGKIGVLLEVNCETDFVARTDEFRTLARYLAEQVAATAPIAVDREQMPADLVERKRQLFEAQVHALGKPQHLAATILDGKMDAYFRDVVLMDQAWVREPKITIADLVKRVSVETGEAVRVRRFARFHMGIA